jgi:hypothetical protein
MFTITAGNLIIANLSSLPQHHLHLTHIAAGRWLEKQWGTVKFPITRRSRRRACAAMTRRGKRDASAARQRLVSGSSAARQRLVGACGCAVGAWVSSASRGELAGRCVGVAGVARGTRRSVRGCRWSRACGVADVARASSPVGAWVSLESRGELAGRCVPCRRRRAGSSPVGEIRRGAWVRQNADTRAARTRAWAPAGSEKADRRRENATPCPILNPACPRRDTCGSYAPADPPRDALVARVGVPRTGRA